MDFMATTPSRTTGYPGEETTEGIVRRVVAHHLQRPVDEIRPGADIQTELSLDSLTLIEINVSLEEHFGVALIDFADDTDIRTVGDVVRYVERRLSEVRS